MAWNSRNRLIRSALVAAIVCELLGIPTDLAPQVLSTVNAGSLAQPGEGVDTGQARPNYFEYLLPAVARRRADPSGEPDRLHPLLASATETRRVRFSCHRHCALITQRERDCCYWQLSFFTF